MKKRISAFLLSVVLCLTMICPAFAAASADPTITLDVDYPNVTVNGTNVAENSARVTFWYRTKTGSAGETNWSSISGAYIESVSNGAFTLTRSVLRDVEFDQEITEDGDYFIFAKVYFGTADTPSAYGYWPVKAEPKGQTEFTLAEGEKRDLEVTVTPEELPDKNVTWASSDPETVAVDENGKITAKKSGAVTITATPNADPEGGTPATFEVTVTAAPSPIKSVTVTSDKSELTVGESIKLSYEVDPETATYTDVTWSSSNPDVADFDENGNLVAKAAGTTKITVTGKDENGNLVTSSEYTIKVQSADTPVVVNSLTVEPLTLEVGETKALTYKVDPSTAEVTWQSDRPDIATVDNGVVTAHKAGTATITARAGDKVASCTVTVNPKVSHNHNYVWQYNDTNHWRECTVCGVKVDDGLHSFDDGVVTTEATFYLDGVRTYTCTVCGYEKTEVIPALGGSIGGGSSTVARPGQSGGNTASSGSNASVVVNRPSSGSTGGTVTISDPNAKPGSKVDVTVTPKKGYALESITVKDSSGKAVTLTNNGNGVYSFTMPEGKVSVDYSFTRTTAKPEVIRGEATFTDVKSDAWYSDAVQYAYQHGIMNGIGNNEFSPETNLTRAMIVQVLYNLEGTPKAPSGDFGDVAAGAWYADPVNWAAANGIVNGYGNGNFGPEDDITREQMAAILYRYAEYKGYDVTKRGDLDQFSDVALVSTWATEAMEWAVGVGLITGTDKGELGPTGTATRAQVATVMMRFCENIMD